MCLVHCLLLLKDISNVNDSDQTNVYIQCTFYLKLTVQAVLVLYIYAWSQNLMINISSRLLVIIYPVKNSLNRTPFLVLSRQVLRLHRLNLFKILDISTKLDVWFRQDSGLFRVRFRICSLLTINLNLSIYDRIMTNKINETENFG